MYVLQWRCSRFMIIKRRFLLISEAYPLFGLDKSIVLKRKGRAYLYSHPASIRTSSSGFMT